MGPLSCMRSVVDRNVVMRRIPVPLNADRIERERDRQRERERDIGTYLMMPPTANIIYSR